MLKIGCTNPTLYRGLPPAADPTLHKGFLMVSILRFLKACFILLCARGGLLVKPASKNCFAGIWWTSVEGLPCILDWSVGLMPGGRLAGLDHVPYESLVGNGKLCPRLVFATGADFSGFTGNPKP